mmetsp:Transcript_31307/g.57919  ORF Transcript_31307/g.57919 Transcript_31307/m.57919 type:complete len:218 (+) Transcript_31307:763-1416(+)
MAATNVCLKFPFISLRINSFSFTRSIRSFTFVPCFVAIPCKSCSNPTNTSASACKSSTECVRKSISLVKRSTSFRILPKDVRKPSFFAIPRCLCATVGELTMQIPPIIKIIALGTDIIATADAANPPVTNKDTARVETISFPNNLGGSSAESNNIPSSSSSSESLSVSVNPDDRLLGINGSLRAVTARVCAAAELYLPARRIPDAMVPKKAVGYGDC